METVGHTGLLDRVTAYWEHHIHTLGSFTVGLVIKLDVGDEDIWHVSALCEGGKAAWVRLGGGLPALLGASSDFDGGTVHVHLTVSDAVEPSPGKSVLSRSNARWDLELELGCSVSVRVLWKVAVDVGRAASKDRVDDLELRVLGWLLVGGKTDLAGSASVDCRTLEGQGDALANRKHVLAGVELSR